MSLRLKIYHLLTNNYEKRRMNYTHSIVFIVGSLNAPKDGCGDNDFQSCTSGW